MMSEDNKVGRYEAVVKSTFSWKGCRAVSMQRIFGQQGTTDFIQGMTQGLDSSCSPLWEGCDISEQNIYS